MKVNVKVHDEIREGKEYIVVEGCGIGFFLSRGSAGVMLPTG